MKAGARGCGVEAICKCTSTYSTAYTDLGTYSRTYQGHPRIKDISGYLPWYQALQLCSNRLCKPTAAPIARCLDPAS